eukprot:4668641-Prymnesium_polylepis.1
MPWLVSSPDLILVTKMPARAPVAVHVAQRGSRPHARHMQSVECREHAQTRCRACCCRAAAPLPYCRAAMLPFCRATAALPRCRAA